MTVTASVTISSEQRTLVGRRRYRFACVRRQQLRSSTISEVCPEIPGFMTQHRQEITIRYSIKARNTALEHHREAAQEYKTP